MSAYDCVIRNGTAATPVTPSRPMSLLQGGKSRRWGPVLRVARSRSTRQIGLYCPVASTAMFISASRPSGDAVCADTFASATLSAAFGGNSCVMPFALQEDGRSLRQTVDGYHVLAKGQCAVDYAFHLIVPRADEQTLGQDLPALIQDGYKSLKV